MHGLDPWTKLYGFKNIMEILPKRGRFRKLVVFGAQTLLGDAADQLSNEI